VECGGEDNGTNLASFAPSLAEKAKNFSNIIAGEKMKMWGAQILFLYFSTISMINFLN
jgi:hypothetical protein